jgi:hypothetical protein
VRKTAFLAFAIFVLIGTPARAEEPPTSELQVQARARSDQKARELWARITPEDREAIKQLLEDTNNLLYVKSNITAYLSQGRRADAIRLIDDYYHLGTNRAAAVVDLIGYANGLE